MTQINSLYDLETLFIEKLQEKHKLTMRDVKKAFAKFDLDNNGLLDLQEMTRGIQSFLNGVKESQVQELVQQYDLNGDGKISYEEFLHLLTHRTAIDPDDNGVGSMNKPPPAPVRSTAARNSGNQGQNQQVKAQIAEQYLHRLSNNNNNNTATNSNRQPPRPPSPYAISESASSGGAFGGYQHEFERPPSGLGRRSGQFAGCGDMHTEDGDRATSETVSNIDAHDPRALEYRSKIYLHNLRQHFLNKALQLRLQGQVPHSEKMTLEALQETVARQLLAKAFQPYTGWNAREGRVREQLQGLELGDFRKVLRSFNFPGMKPITNETIHYLFDLCSAGAQLAATANSAGGQSGRTKQLLTNEEGRPVADANTLIDLIFGVHYATRRDEVTHTLQAHDPVHSVTAINHSKVLDQRTGTVLKTYEHKVNAGRDVVKTGPVRIPVAIDHHYEKMMDLLAVPLRFVSRKSRSALATPSNLDPVPTIARSNTMPAYWLERKHCFGLSTTHYSGNTFYVLPYQPDALQSSALQQQALIKGQGLTKGTQNKGSTSTPKDGEFIDNATIIYTSAGLGVVHSLSNNKQLFFDDAEDDITCITISQDGSLAATGCMGRDPVAHVWSTNIKDSKASLCMVGKGFFSRGVCALSFSYDNKYLIGIGCDDNHALGIFDLTQNGLKICEQPAQHGIPPQIHWLRYCPSPQYTEYITRDHSGLCDLFVSAGEHHLRFWSFVRPVNGDLKTASLDYKGAAITHTKNTALSKTPLNKDGVVLTKEGALNKANKGPLHKGLHKAVTKTIGEPNNKDSALFKGTTSGVPLTKTSAKLATSLAKCYTCCDFIPCEDKSYDIISGGTNGILYLWRKGLLVCSSPVMPRGGRIQCLVVGQQQGDHKVYVGGQGGVLKICDGRTLATLRQFNLMGESALPPPPPRPSSASKNKGNLTSSVLANALAGKVDKPSNSNNNKPRAMSATPSARAANRIQADALQRPVSAGNNNNNNNGRLTPAGKPSAMDTHSGHIFSHLNSDAAIEKDADMPDLLESGAKVVTGLAVVANPGVHGNVYVIATLGTGKMVRVDVTSRGSSAGAQSGGRSATADAANQFSGKDLLYYHTGPLWGLAADVTPSERLFVTVGDDRKLMVWDSLDCVLIAKTHTKTPSRCCHLDRTNCFIAVGSTIGSLTIYFLSDTLHGTNNYYLIHEVAFRKDCTLEVTEVKFAPSNEMVAIGCRDDAIHLYSCQLTVSEDVKGRETHLYGNCVLRALHKLRGHSATITHIDWSYDSRLLQSTCTAYELLCWDVETGKQNTGVNVADVRWKTHHCILGFAVMGIWPMYSDGTDVHAVDVSSEKGIVASANDDHGLVRLFNYPCVVKNAPAREYTGHSSHVTNVKFVRGGDRLMSTGGNDGSVMVFDVVQDGVHPDPFRDVKNR